jgi:hypothetical protein
LTRLKMPEDALELRVAHVEGVVMALARPLSALRAARGVRVVGEVERQALVDLHLREVAAARLDGESEDLGEEPG